MLGWIEYKTIRRKYFGETKREEIREGWNKYKMAKQDLSMNDFNKACKALQAANVPGHSFISILPKATCPCGEVPFGYFPCEEMKKEGKTPMKNYNDSYACASVSTAKSDTAVTRDYLLNRLENARYPKERGFTDTFNLYVDNFPKTYKELIDVIKNGKYTIDSKIEKQLAAVEADPSDSWYAGAFAGFIWDGPKADRPGYDQAVKDLKDRQIKARDTIMVKDADAGLAALEAFEAWTPTVATTVN